MKWRGVVQYPLCFWYLRRITERPCCPFLFLSYNPPFNTRVKEIVIERMKLKGKNKRGVVLGKEG
jgi:hypothetical protein